jgi:3-hydroxyisobutyrate dehydrogenase-like beta-hydroxyacid dehydrogenase
LYREGRGGQVPPRFLSGLKGKTMRFGFLGLGIMGAPMAGNLIKAGYEITVWNRTGAKCKPLVALGAKRADSPAEVVAATDVTFAMLADPEAASEVVFTSGGVIEGMTDGKGYVDMSTVDEGTSRRISNAVIAAGGRFLEAPVSGTKKPAEDGTLIILAAGNETLYEDASPLLDLMGNKRVFLGEVGQAARMKLVVNMIMGGMMSSFCEGLALGTKGGLGSGEILDVLAAGALANPMFAGKGSLISRGEFGPAFPLKHMQKDLRLAVELGDILGQSVPSAGVANQTFLQAMAAGLGDEDFSAVYKTVHD